MKILITGTAGFIGYHLVKAIASQNYEIIGLDNINDYYDVRLKYSRLEDTGIEKDKINYGEYVQSETLSNYKFIKCNLEDKETIDKIFTEKNFDYVCNLAAQAGVRYSITNPYSYISSNINGFMNILEACRHNEVKHLVYASSSSVYGMNEKIPFSTSDNVDHPVSLYAATKKSNELLAHSYSNLYNIPTTGLRFFTVYGPLGRPDMALFLFTKAIFEDKPIQVFNNGEMFRDFTYIDDIVSGLTHIIPSPPKENKNWNGEKPNPAESKAPYKIYNIGNNNPEKLTHFISVIEKEIGKKAEKILMPMQQGDVKKTYADVSGLEKDFGYKPYTPIEEGIRQFVEWYKKYYNL